ncbi:MAG: HAD-IIIA family hydrolase [Patescibacteria group bacterium]
MKKHRAVFIDRDGTINVYGRVWKIEDFEWAPGAREALQALSKTDYKIIVISNQAGIGRGYYTKEDVEMLHDWFKKECEEMGVCIHGIYYCPHHPDEGCVCRKPKPGMLMRAAEEHGIHLKKSWLIGDNFTDIAAGRAVGVRTIKVKNEKLEDAPNIRAHAHAETLKEGIEYILGRSRRFFLAKAVLLVAAIGGVTFLWREGIITKEAIFSFLETNSRLAPFLFIFITAFGVGLMLPLAIFMGMGAGFLWGTWVGGIYTFFALMLGSALGFYISRLMARDAVRQYVNIKLWKRLEEEANQRPWSTVLVVRLSQMVPLGVGTYLFGVTRVGFWKFFFGTAVVMLPSAFLFSAVGDSIGGFVLQGDANAMLQKGSIALFGVFVFMALGYFIKKKHA